MYYINNTKVLLMYLGSDCFVNFSRFNVWGVDFITTVFWCYENHIKMFYHAFIIYFCYFSNVLSKCFILPMSRKYENPQQKYYI